VIELNEKNILIDPYDTFLSVDLGTIEADYTLISSVAHDHGNVGASPTSYTYHERGTTELDNGISITWIMTKEYRGSSNLIYNITTEDISITCFADLGHPSSLDDLTQQERDILASTDIAFVRPNLIGHEEWVSSGELSLRTCEPTILIPYHYFPRAALGRLEALQKREPYLWRLDTMLDKLAYDKKHINGYETTIDLHDFHTKTAILLGDIHPQVSALKKK
jgi:hypothetical protein